MFEVLVRTADGRVIQKLELSTQRRLRIGRSPECEVRIPAATVSRRHAEVRRLEDEGGIWVIRDLDSTHGTFIDGERLDGDGEVEVGTVVKIGPVLIEFADLAGKIGAELDAMLGDDDSLDELEVRIISSSVKSHPDAAETLMDDPRER